MGEVSSGVKCGDRQGAESVMIQFTAPASPNVGALRLLFLRPTTSRTLKVEPYIFVNFISVSARRPAADDVSTQRH